MSNKRATFLVDGFNLYHSAKRASKELGASTKWLDLTSLCKSLLPHFRSKVGEKIQLKDIYYFSAYAHHVSDPDTVERHKKFVRCLEDSGVHVEINRFKYKQVKCDHCNQLCDKYEEKETDVSIALKILDVFLLDECDITVIVSSDTDLAPAVRLVQHKFPTKFTFFAFPAYRKNQELAYLCPGSIKIKPKKYKQFQFPNPYILQDTTQIFKPSSW